MKKLIFFVFIVLCALALLSGCDVLAYLLTNAQNAQPDETPSEAVSEVRNNAPNGVQSTPRSEAPSEPPDAAPSEQPSVEPPRQRVGGLTPAQIYEDNVDAVFIIYTFDANGSFTGNGSGFFVSSAGVAITNHHVMVDAPHAVILTQDGREFDISGYYSYDLDNDLAMIQVDGGGSSFPFLTIGDSDALRVGDSVFAIGSPYGEHNTFSIGNVSRRVNTLDYDIYSINNLIQITAPISPGSSGGALLNDAGEVIGITTAVHTIGANMGYAVPIDRVNISDSEGGRYLPLPIGRTVQATPPPVGDQSFTERYSLAPSVPTFGSVSNNAWFMVGGLAGDLGFDVGLNYSFDYVYAYSLATRHFITDTELYSSVLIGSGFSYQETIRHENTVQVYFFKASENISVLHVYSENDEILIVAIGSGNALERLTAAVPSAPGDTPAFSGYDRFPYIPAFHMVIPNVILHDEGFAYEFGIVDDNYILDDDYVYAYRLANSRFVGDSDDYDDILLVHDFEVQSMNYYENADLFVAHFYHTIEQMNLVYVYYYADGMLYIAIGR